MDKKCPAVWVSWCPSEKGARRKKARKTRPWLTLFPLPNASFTWERSVKRGRGKWKLGTGNGAYLAARMSAWPINLVLSAQVKSWLDSTSWITDQASGERRSNRSLDAAFADGVTNNYANEQSSIGPDWLDYPVDGLHRSCAGTKSICILFRSPLEEHASLHRRRLRPGLVLHNLNNYATCWLPFWSRA